MHADRELEISKKPDLVDPNAALNSLGLKVSMYITNIGAHGYPGTGKTSLLNLAMGKDPAAKPRPVQLLLIHHLAT